MLSDTCLPSLVLPTGPVYDISMRAPKHDGPAHRFISWNVAGMRALMKKDAEALRRLVEAEQLDAVCLQVCAQLSVVEQGTLTAPSIMAWAAEELASRPIS